MACHWLSILSFPVWRDPCPKPWLPLDKLARKPLNRTGERVLKLELEGKAFAYNRLNGVYYVHNLKGGKEIDEALTSRWDWAHEEFGRAVRQEISRALRAK